MLCILVFAVLFQFSEQQDITNLDDVLILSELPLDKLLTLRKSFYVEEIHNDLNISKSGDESVPQAQALQAQKNKPKDRGTYYQQPYPYYHYVEDYKGDKKGVQSIFQMSITTLAFLAFGGYLLCLLVQAVKGKSNYYNYDTNIMTQVMATYLASRLKKRKNIRTPQRLQKRPININRRPMQKHRSKRDLSEEGVTDDLYYVLINLSEAYANYHPINYKHVNSSVYLK